MADALEALGYQGSKSTVYRDVQAAGEAVHRIRQSQGERRVQVMSTDATYVLCNRCEVTIAVAVDALCWRSSWWTWNRPTISALF